MLRMTEHEGNTLIRVASYRKIDPMRRYGVLADPKIREEVKQCARIIDGEDVPEASEEMRQLAAEHVRWVANNKKNGKRRRRAI